MTPEWPHKIPVDTIDHTPKTFSIAASEAQCRDLARRLKVLKVEDLKAELTASRADSRHVVHVRGRLSGFVTQACVVTLEPVREAVEGEVEGWFSDQDQVVSLKRVRRERKGQIDSEIEVEDEKDDPEAIVDGQIDLGELTVQHLSIYINSYPRAPDAALPDAVKAQDPQTDGAIAPVRPNPFAALKDWKARGKGDK